MKVSIKNKSDSEVNEMISILTDKDSVNALGYKFALPLIEGDVLEIRYYGTHKKQGKMIKPIGLKSSSYCRHMNMFGV